MEKLLKTLRRTVVLKGLANRFGRESLERLLRLIEACSKRCLATLWSIEHLTPPYIGSSTVGLERYPWLPTRIVKGFYRECP